MCREVKETLNRGARSVSISQGIRWSMSKARKERKSVENRNNTEEKQGLSRRTLLKNAAGAVIAASGAALGSAVGARAQAQGSMAGGGAVPLRLPLGAMNYLDRNQYIHNMEIHSHLPGVGIT